MSKCATYRCLVPFWLIDYVIYGPGKLLFQKFAFSFQKAHLKLKTQQYFSLVHAKIMHLCFIILFVSLVNNKTHLSNRQIIVERQKSLLETTSPLAVVYSKIYLTHIS